MKMIANIVAKIDDELEGAQGYAEDYIYEKSKGNSNTASTLKQMAAAELEHAAFQHKRAVEEIERVKQVYTAPAEMEEKWKEVHKEYVDKVARIKMMLQ